MADQQGSPVATGILTDREAADRRASAAVGEAHNKLSRAVQTNRGQGWLALRTGLHEALRDLPGRLIEIYVQIEGASEAALRNDLVTAVTDCVIAFIRSSVAGQRGANAILAYREAARLIPSCKMSIPGDFDLALYEHAKRRQRERDDRTIIHNTTYNNSGQVAAMGPNASAVNNVQVLQVQQPWSTDDFARVKTEVSQLRKTYAKRLAETDDDTGEDAIELGRIGEVERAAKNGDQNGVVDAFKRLGHKTWDLAQQLGLAYLKLKAGNALGLASGSNG